MANYKPSYTIVPKSLFFNVEKGNYGGLYSLIRKSYTKLCPNKSIELHNTKQIYDLFTIL